MAAPRGSRKLWIAHNASGHFVAFSNELAALRFAAANEMKVLQVDYGRSIHEQIEQSQRAAPATTDAAPTTKE